MLNNSFCCGNEIIKKCLLRHSRIPYNAFNQSPFFLFLMLSYNITYVTGLYTKFFIYIKLPFLPYQPPRLYLNITNINNL